MAHEAWMHKPPDENGMIQCLACSQYCKIPKGKRGICAVRENQDGKLMLLVYGKAAAYHVDPVEKKPLFHFMPGTDIFSLGTVGCNFRCSFCQNWDISQASKPPENRIFGDDLSPEYIVDYCLKHNYPSIAYTYNEPSIFFEYAYDTARLAHEKGLKNVYVSNGYLSREAVTKFKPYLDAINIDLKAFTDRFYTKICGARLQPVLDGIKLTHELGIHLEVTTLVIPGENDSTKELRQAAEFLAGIDPDIPWHISRFFPAYLMNDKEPTPLKTLLKAYEIGKKAGLNYVYVGNIATDKYENTYCHKCDTLLIERHGYMVETHYKEPGKCPECDERFPLIV
jgi:pyruvate formate lyase activating enzyme